MTKSELKSQFQNSYNRESWKPILKLVFGQINYWEGAINVEAIINGKKIKGLGFMELVGYPSDYNYLILEGEKIKKEIFNLTKKIFTKK